MQTLRSRVEQLELQNSEKDRTITRHADALQRNDVIMAEVTRSVTSLEASLSESRDLLAARERSLAAKVRELDSKSAECVQTREMLDSRSEEVQRLRESIVRAEDSASEKSRQLEESSKRVANLEADNADLRARLVSVSDRLEETCLQLTSVLADRQRLETDLERHSRALEELAARPNPSSQDLLRTSLGLSSNATAVRGTPTSTSTHSAAKKLFEVQVKHEKSPLASSVPPSMTHHNHESNHCDSTAHQVRPMCYAPG